jgi:hypothetical protein
LRYEADNNLESKWFQLEETQLHQQRKQLEINVNTIKSRIALGFYSFFVEI